MDEKNTTPKGAADAPEKDNLTLSDNEALEAQTDATEADTSDFLNNPNVLAFIQKSVQEGIQQALKGKAPKASAINPTAAERTAFDKMTYKQRVQLFQSNPHSYHKLAKGGR